jgi:hypothetical protein
MLLPTGRESGHRVGNPAVQSARPRDLGALVLVVAVFLTLFVMSITLGSPAIR